MSLYSIVLSVVSFLLGCFFGSFVLIRLVWSIIKSPRKMLHVKNRDKPPSCLTDPKYGTHHYIQLKDVKLHYVAKGDENKPLMLFVHGFPEFWYSWRFQITEFSKDYRVVAIDQRGYNDSDKPKGVYNYTVDKLTDDLKQLIPALGYKSCVLVGHDWGGAVCWGFAGRNPKMVDKLIVMNCPHPKAFRKHLQSNKSQFLKSWYMYFFQLPWLPEYFFRFNDYASLETTLTSKKMGLQCSKATQDDVESYKHAFSKKGAKTGSINYYRAAARYPSASPSVEVPSLLIWGCKDAAIDVLTGELSHQYASNLIMNKLEASSHWVQMDEPVKVNKLMREYLSKK